jgi:hypothetical protein
MYQFDSSKYCPFESKFFEQMKFELPKVEILAFWNLEFELET